MDGSSVKCAILVMIPTDSDTILLHLLIIGMLGYYWDGGSFVGIHPILIHIQINALREEV